MSKKILLWGGGVVLVVGVLVWYISATEEPFVPRDFNEVVAELKDPKKIQEYSDRLVEAYKKDTDGGDTPEETLNLFIAALKAGDTDKAAKYFLLEKQGQMTEELKISKQNNVLPLLIGDLEKEKKVIQISEAQYRFRTYDEKGVAEFSFDLIINPYTQKWKIESL